MGGRNGPEYADQGVFEINHDISPYFPFKPAALRIAFPSQRTDTNTSTVLVMFFGILETSK
jgi:hypothetical protein